MGMSLRAARIAVIVVSALAFVGAASARSDRSSMTAREHMQKAVIHASEGGLRFCRNHPLAHVFCTARNLHFLRARVGWTQEELRETLAALRPVVRVPASVAASTSIPHYAEWMCLAKYESGTTWTINTDNSYHGALQMDRAFEAAYGPEFVARWGDAESWPPWAQMVAAERAWQTRGFGPWPVTRRRCGI